MATDTANPYFRTQVLTASPEQLRLMLLDGAIKFARQGRDAIVNKDYEAIYTGFTKARNIVLELTNTLRADLDAELKSNLTNLYTFIYTQLVDAGFERDTAKAETAINRLEYERETWVMAMAQAARESGTLPIRPTSAPVQAPPPRMPLSLQG